MSVRVLLLLVLFGAAAAAHAGEDEVVLTSGNRMTGTIRELERGQLSFSIDGARNRTKIKWSNIAELRSPKTFDIELASGERYSGPIAISSGALQLGAANGLRTLEMRDVLRIEPVTGAFFDRVDGGVDLGLDFLSAGDEIDWTLNADLARRTPRHLTELTINSLLRRHDDVTAQRRNHIDLTRRRFRENRWFALGQLLAEEDRELDLKSRYLIAAAYGRTLVQSHRTTFSLYGGVDVDWEEYRGFEDETVFEVLGALEWDWFEVGGDTQLGAKATTYFDPDDSRVRFELTSTLRRDFASDYYWSLNLYESYNSDPPEGLEKSDFGISIAIGRSF
jgi:hypothetical protein